MAGFIEITIKKEIIQAKATKLDSIAKDVFQKKITGTVNNSKGKTANSMNNLIQELNNMGSALGTLMSTNVENVRNIADQFSAKDTDLASKFKG